MFCGVWGNTPYKIMNRSPSQGRHLREAGAGTQGKRKKEKKKEKKKKKEEKKKEGNYE